MFLSQEALEEMDTPLVILAGGRATRLGPLSEDRPKSLVDVGLNQRFTDVQLAWASEQGFRDVVLSVGYRGKQIEEYCRDGSWYAMRLRYAYDGAEPLGTGGAVRRAFRCVHLIG
jgi:NDP-sugar pyrophosphorylase family protein